SVSSSYNISLLPKSTMVSTRSSAAKEPETHVITGGGGFPGFSLGKRLAKKGHKVKLFDLKEPVWELEDGMEFIQGNITEGETLSQVIKGASAVYH
ncbi:unnamed protein product, partial [Lymnaea stagnalis]